MFSTWSHSLFQLRLNNVLGSSIWSKSGNQGNQWTIAQVTMRNSQINTPTYQVTNSKQSQHHWIFVLAIQRFYEFLWASNFMEFIKKKICWCKFHGIFKKKILLMSNFVDSLITLYTKKIGIQEIWWNLNMCISCVKSAHVNR